MSRTPLRTLARLGVLALPAALGCDGLATAPVCTAEARPALILHVTDAATGTPIAAGSTLLVRDGEFADSVTIPDAAPNTAALVPPQAVERPGTYDLTVSRTGYATWTATDVAVTAGVCHVNTVTRTAALVPSN